MLSGTVISDIGVEMLCIEIFKKAIADYHNYRERMNDPSLTEKKRKIAEKNLALLEESFLSGAMDAYAVLFSDGVFPGCAGGDAPARSNPVPPVDG